MELTRLGILAAAMSVVVGCENPTDPNRVPRVTFDLTRTEIYVGESVPITLTATNARGDKITATHVEWYSSDSTVARLTRPVFTDRPPSENGIYAARFGSARIGAVVDGIRGEIQLKVMPAPVPAAPTELQGGFYARGRWVSLSWKGVVPYSGHEYRIEKKQNGVWSPYGTRYAYGGPADWNDNYPGPPGTTQEYRVLLCNGTGCSAPSNAVSVAIP